LIDGLLFGTLYSLSPSVLYSTSLPLLPLSFVRDPLSLKPLLSFSLTLS